MHMKVSTREKKRLLHDLENTINVYYICALSDLENETDKTLYKQLLAAKRRALSELKTIKLIHNL